MSTDAASGEGTTRVLGLDPGSRTVGYAVVESVGPGRFRYIECGTIRTDPRRPITARLVEIARELRALCDEFRPDVCAVEDVFQRRFPRSALILGHARGVVLLTAAEAELAVTSYPPATVKKMVCGNGRAGKEQIQRMVTALAGLRSPPPLDAADALAVAICHCLHLSPGGTAIASIRRGHR